MQKDRKFTLELSGAGLAFAKKCLKENLKQHFKDTGKMNFKEYDKDEIENFLRLVVVTVANNVMGEISIETYKEDDTIPY